MPRTATFIGFGEAGQAFAFACARAFDIATLIPETRDCKFTDFRLAGVKGCGSAEEALGGAFLILSLVTADQAVAAARSCAPFLGPGSFWFDCNSVAPGTKREAAAIIEAVGARYIDVAIMSPAQPAQAGAPLLVAGPDAGDGAALLEVLGFSNVTIAGRTVGDATAVKMIRSVMVKGIEALSAECLLAAERAGVLETVVASLDSSWTESGWSKRADYNLDRMLTHGLRRAAEMEEVAKTLAEAGINPVMTRGTITRQREIGGLKLAAPAGLAEKLAAISTRTEKSEEDKAA